MTARPSFTLREIFGTLRLPQLWALGSAVAATLIGVFALGGIVQDLRNERVSFLQTERISHLEKEKDKQADVISSLKDSLVKEITKFALLESKANFLHHYYSYASTHHKTSRKNFADYVCLLWKKSEERAISMETRELQLSSADLLKGWSADHEEILVAHGFDPQEIDQIRRAIEGERVSLREGAPDVSKPFTSNLININSALREHGSEYTKTVTFFDRSTYTIPDLIALDVHDRKVRGDCSPS